MVIEALIVYMYLQKDISVQLSIRDISDVHECMQSSSLVLNTSDLWEDIRAQQVILQSA